jgi:hypothetical protein
MGTTGAPRGNASRWATPFPPCKHNVAYNLIGEGVKGPTGLAESAQYWNASAGTPIKMRGQHAYAKISQRSNNSDASPIQTCALFAREEFSTLIHCSTTVLNIIASFKISSASVSVETNA